MIKQLTAIVYKCKSGRRYFTLAGAINAEARFMYRQKYPCECEMPVYPEYPGYVCEIHSNEAFERELKVRARLKRFIKRAYQKGTQAND